MEFIDTKRQQKITENAPIWTKVVKMIIYFAM